MYGSYLRRVYGRIWSRLDRLSRGDVTELNTFSFQNVYECFVPANRDEFAKRNAEMDDRIYRVRGLLSTGTITRR